MSDVDDINAKFEEIGKDIHLSDDVHEGNAIKGMFWGVVLSTPFWIAGGLIGHWIWRAFGG